MNPCIVCELTVRPRQQALLCDGCQRWQHRTCNTGIGQDDYREAVRLDQSINWRCHSCEDVEEPPVPILNSTYRDADQEATPLLFSDRSFQSDLSQAMETSINVMPAGDESSIAEPPPVDEETMVRSINYK